MSGGMGEEEGLAHYLATDMGRYCIESYSYR